jgi:hypothetical protein
MRTVIALASSPGRLNDLERPNQNARTRTTPPPQEPDEQWPKHGPENGVDWSNRSRRKEGMLGHQSELASQVFHDLRAAGENPATGRDLDVRIQRVFGSVE